MEDGSPTLQSSLIQEVVQVEQSVSGGQVLDEALRRRMRRGRVRLGEESRKE